MGAGLSMLDLGSDINVILLYARSTKEVDYGMSLLGMLVLCLTIQVWIVVLQNRTKPRTMMKEIIFVVTGVKPG